MDIEKAIDCLKADKEYLTDMKICDGEEMDVAIKALEEVEQYRAIGTVEGYERVIESSIENYNLYREYKAKVQEYRAIGTVNECREAVEKMKPKKTAIEAIKVHICPVCGFGGIYDYCGNCGHRVQMLSD